MSKAKAFLKSDGVRAFCCWLGSVYIRFVYLTGRWDTINGDIPAAFWRRRKPFILAFWHGRLLMMPCCWSQSVTIRMLISAHRDGQLIANTVKHLGIETIEGSSSKGGAQALRAMLKTLKKGDCVGITPDGPRGPRMRASDGAIAAAKLSGAPIVPVSFSARRAKPLKSWDRFLVAKPFHRGVLVFGEPLNVDRSLDADGLNKARQTLEDRLNAISHDADTMMGVTPIEPADLSSDAPTKVRAEPS